MTYRKAVIHTAFRFGVLCGGVLLLWIPATLLPPELYPGGKNGILAFIIVILTIMAATLIVVSWVAMPLFHWLNENSEERRQQLLRSDK